MGPDFPLQRIRVTSRGWEELQPRHGAGDCSTRWGNDPEYVQPEERTISLSADVVPDPEACRHTETD
jgi:hypothetical protein